MCSSVPRTRRSSQNAVCQGGAGCTSRYSHAHLQDYIRRSLVIWIRLTELIKQHSGQKTCPEYGPNFGQNLSNMLPKTCLKHVRNLSKTCPTHIQNMSQTCPTHVQNMSQTCPKHTQNMSTKYPRHSANMSVNHPRLVPNVSETCSKKSKTSKYIQHPSRVYQNCFANVCIWHLKGSH